MPRTLANLTAFAIILLSGAAQGLWTGRWAPSRELRDAVARLDRVPGALEGWGGRAIKMDRRLMEHAGVEGYLARQVVDPRDGAEATILIVCGRPGPVAVHTPDVCYEGAGYAATAPPVVERVPMADGRGGVAEFKTAEFRQSSAVEPRSLRIAWSWNAGDAWKAPENPRLEFAASRALTKLYVIQDAPREGSSPEAEAEARTDLLRRLVVDIGKALDPGSMNRDLPMPAALLPTDLRPLTVTPIHYH